MSFYISHLSTYLLLFSPLSVVVLVESLGSSGLLGGGRSDEMYPSFGSGRAFSDDGEWRVML